MFQQVAEKGLSQTNVVGQMGGGVTILENNATFPIYS
jgi:hypothetical protein